MDKNIYFLYLLLTVLLIVFTFSLIGIKYVESYLEDKDKKGILDKYVSFFLPTTSLFSFFIACFIVSKVLLKGGGQYVGIYFILLITLILFILNNTVLKDEEVKEYIKGKKFSVIGMLMISGVSALVFGFIDNFGLSLGIEALDHKFLNIFLGPFSTDDRFIPEKKVIARNLVNINNWNNGKWRSVINHVLRMKEDIRKFKEMGCKGIVSGVLTDDNSIDMKRTKELVKLSRPMEFTFHRAFDIVTDPLKELENLIELGVNRVLTSGQKNKAIDGLELLKKFKNISKNRIKIMPGSGINKSNIVNFRSFEEIHGSFNNELNTIVALAKG